jgi:hypothetical protein
MDYVLFVSGLSEYLVLDLNDTKLISVYQVLIKLTPSLCLSVSRLPSSKYCGYLQESMGPFGSHK